MRLIGYRGGLLPGYAPDIPQKSNHTTHNQVVFLYTLFYWLQGIKNNDKSHTERVGI